MAKKIRLQTSDVMNTSRDPGINAGHSVHGRSEPVRPPMVADVASMNVREFDTFTPGCPRPFVSVHRFGPDNQSGFPNKRVPPVVTGRGRG